MGATIEERTGLQRAIQKAIEKEDSQKKKPTSFVTYVAKYRVSGKLLSVSSRNKLAFRAAVEQLQKTNPKLPVTLFKVTSNA